MSELPLIPSRPPPPCKSACSFLEASTFGKMLALRILPTRGSSFSQMLEIKWEYILGAQYLIHQAASFSSHTKSPLIGPKRKLKPESALRTVITNQDSCLDPYQESCIIQYLDEHGFLHFLLTTQLFQINFNINNSSGKYSAKLVIF